MWRYFEKSSLVQVPPPSLLIHCQCIRPRSHGTYGLIGRSCACGAGLKVMLRAAQNGPRPDRSTEGRGGLYRSREGCFLLLRDGSKICGDLAISDSTPVQPSAFSTSVVLCLFCIICLLPIARMVVIMTMMVMMMMMVMTKVAVKFTDWSCVDPDDDDDY